ncbi:MAG: phosphonate metabolism transcriptional regulator PhnF [Halothiobacillaceae bacterium]|nr:MAG: phosphonate metabolism transcriptional regulator PhnF [Halothiobacillaceae bacterium]
MSLYALKRESGSSVFRQIASALEAEIKARYRPGDRLPAEPELTERFGVNRHTLRHAVDVLVEAGLLERRHGRGTFVLSLIDYAISTRTRFTEQLESQGRSTDTEIMRRLIVPAANGVARRLGLAEGADVLFLETRRHADGQPFCLVSHFLPAMDYAEPLEAYTGGSLHAFLSDCLSLRLRRVESLVTATLPQGDDAGLLSMPRNAPVLRVKSLNVSEATGEPVEYALTRFRADRTQLSVMV